MPNPYELWSFLLSRQLLFAAPFDLVRITLRLGFCATLFDPVHDIVVFVAVPVGPFANSIGHLLRAWFRRAVPLHAWHISETMLF
jgi:hypothetical protein